MREDASDIGRTEARTAICKIIGIFLLEVAVHQGQFYVLSAFSVEQSGRKMQKHSGKRFHLYCISAQYPESQNILSVPSLDVRMFVIGCTPPQRDFRGMCFEGPDVLFTVIGP